MIKEGKEEREGRKRTEGNGREGKQIRRKQSKEEMRKGRKRWKGQGRVRKEGRKEH